MTWCARRKKGESGVATIVDSIPSIKQLRPRISPRRYTGELVSLELSNMVASGPQTAEQLRAFLNSTPSSVSTPLALQQALQAVQDLASHPQGPYQRSRSIPNFDQDSFSPLLHEPSSEPPVSSSNPSATSSPTPALDWLHTALTDEFKAAQVIEILQSERDDADIQESLLNVWGFEGIEDMGEAVRRRREIVAEASWLSAESAQHDTDNTNREPTSQLSAHARDYTPGASLQFATQEEVQAMKHARKLMKKEKGKARADGEYYDEPDVEEWLRRREESLAKGPGALISGKRVSYCL